MPAILTTSYFNTGELFIPSTQNVPDIQDNVPSAQAELTLFIEKYEKILLVNALGVVQYNELMAHLSDTSGKWYDFIIGKEYDNKVWTGIKPVIATFVFCKYLLNDKSYYTGVGMERSNAKNSASVNPTLKLTEVWNSFVELYGYDYRCDYTFYYPFFYFESWYWEWNNHKDKTFVSLKQFLDDFPEDYSTEYFKYYEVENRFGL